jgi:hypothetical protein
LDRRHPGRRQLAKRGGQRGPRAGLIGQRKEGLLDGLVAYRFRSGKHWILQYARSGQGSPLTTPSSPQSGFPRGTGPIGPACLSTAGIHRCGRLNSSRHRIVLFSAAIAGSALIAWTSLGEWKQREIGPDQQDYYNLLVAGFRKGSLALDIPVPDALRNAENPWDPAKRPPDSAPHDVSYYNGHFYLYFGVVPVATLFWPFRAVVGHDLPLVYAMLVYSIGAFLLASWLWLRLVRDNFPRAGLTTKLAGMAAAGLAGGQLVLARRASIWELPIAAGHYFVVWMLVSGYLALRSRRPWVWLAVSGLALGLAVGSRPTLVAAGAGLAVIVAGVGAQAFEKGRCWGAAKRGTLAAVAAGGPLAAVLAALLAYNHARFGRLTEFGLNYQLTGGVESKVRHFSLSYVPFNFSVYFLQPPQWGRYFPFLNPISAPPAPPGYYGIEFVYGALVICPVIWWAICLPAGLRSAVRGSAISPFAASVAATAAATTALLLCFNTAAARYMADFVPWWVWLGVLGWAGLEHRLSAERSSWRITRALLRAAFAASAALSCIVAFCASVELHGILRFSNPGAYSKVARVFDAPVALEEHLAGIHEGPLEMDVTFPAAPTGSYEPLVITGISYNKDFTYAYYQAPGIVRLGYMATNETNYNSDPIPIVPGRRYRIRIETGSLYPPEELLSDKGWSQNDIRITKQWVRIDLDGHPVLRARTTWHEASAGIIQVGRDAPGPAAYGARFSGSITGVHRVPWTRPEVAVPPAGDINLGLVLPDLGAAGIQPLVAAGRAGQADLLGIRMRDPRSATLIYESWGLGTYETAPFALPGKRLATFRVRLGPLLQIDDHSPLAVLRRTLAVWMNGSPVMWVRTFRSLEPEPDFSFLANNPGSSIMMPAFQGRLDSMSSEAAIPAWRGGPFAALELDLAGHGDGTEPLLATGLKGRSDTLAIEWLPGERARLQYGHSGQKVVASPVFPWPDRRIHTLKAEIPSLRSLDLKEGARGADGMLRVDIDGERVWEMRVPFHAASSDSVAVGRNGAQASFAATDLHCVVIGLRQVPE